MKQSYKVEQVVTGNGNTLAKLVSEAAAVLALPPEGMPARFEISWNSENYPVRSGDIWLLTLESEPSSPSR